MVNSNQVNLPVDFFLNKLEEAKTHFERALDCKHTEFDDLYPYMIEHPQFFWYKRYVAWSELLTIVKLCEELELPWTESFAPHQAEYVQGRVMSSKVLDYWYETNDSKEHVG
ncbi:hypothetical protein B1A99_15595 [Cohnella sp. CIP 111063]|jgi:hypothetical protein|uniref:hypothetical protein n=1 Tax=unclassified Cohnella TaxID=2636738 RepID=UPI000B8BFF05|nr:MULTISPECIES: hypothetical protein [unclassified Cohnella]OXS58051.1 hypothetical protein B1A99_15595 [Cohnella sp. CIP 111063]PRX71390.1 hypothetical protein B0G52_109188 [Cohnella sp. SGD-V74]